MLGEERVPDPTLSSSLHSCDSPIDHTEAWRSLGECRFLPLPERRFTVSPDFRSSRFVVLHHTVGESLERTSESHFDWMFEQQGSLRTFATQIIASLESSTWGSESESPAAVAEMDAQPLPHHRREYLDFEGEISAGRGRVRRVIAGTFECHQDNENEFIARIAWHHQGDLQQAEAAFYRNLSDGLRFSDNREAWRLRLTPWSYETN